MNYKYDIFCPPPLISTVHEICYLGWTSGQDLLFFGFACLFVFLLFIFLSRFLKHIRAHRFFFPIMFCFGCNCGCKSIFQRVIVPKSFYSERFLFRRIIILKSFISKSCYSEKFLSRRIVILKFGIMTLWN